MIVFQNRFLFSSGGIGRDSKLFLHFFEQNDVHKSELVATNFPILLRNRDNLVFKSQIDPYLLLGTKGLIWQRVHDIFPRTHPEWFTLKSRISFSIGLLFLRRKKVFFICNSNATRNALIENKIGTMDNSIVVHCADSIGDDEECGFCQACNFIRDKSYCLTVGTIEPRKNYKYVIEQWAETEGTHLLIVVGRYGWRAKKEARGLKKAKKIVWLENVCDAQLIQLYQEAALYFSASLDEGFNIPVTEALNRSLPVLISDIPVHRELYGERATYFDLDKNLPKSILENLILENGQEPKPIYTVADFFEEIGGLNVFKY
jgi:glycosyltransferase involved in cell wall biosynthesis